MKYLLIAVGLIVIIAYVFARKRQPQMRVGEILPSREMKEKYGLTAENRQLIHIDAENVPEHLRDLIPMAEMWGEGDDIVRLDIEEKASAQEFVAFETALNGRTAEVTAWLDSFDADLSGDNPMTEEAGHFMYMLVALDESGNWPD